jgi:hypothetical protein
LSLAALAVLSCGGTPPAPQAPAGAKPLATAAPAPPPDLGAVPEPPGLVLSGSVAKLGATLATVHDWAGVPMVDASQVTRLLAGQSLGPIVDLDQPIDFALAYSGNNPPLVVSAAVKDPDRARAALAERFKLVPGDNGVMLLQSLAPASPKAEGDDDKDDDDEEHSCELAPAYGSAPLRLVCGSAPEALAKLGPWLTRTATRSTSPSSLHADLRMGPLRPLIAKQKRILGLAVGSAIGTRLRAAGARELLSAVTGDMVDLATDLDAVSLDVTLGDAGALASFGLKLGGSTSEIGRLITGHADRSGPAPASFWQLPGDADAAVFSRGIDDADVAHAREMVLRAAGEVLTDAGVKDADRKALLDAVAKVPTFPAMVYASGADAAAAKRALAAGAAITTRDDTPERREANRAASEALMGWKVIGFEDPAAKLPAVVKDIAAAWGRPGVAAGLRAKNKDVPPPAVRTEPLPKGAGLPAGSVAYVLEIAERTPASRAETAKAKPDEKKKPAAAPALKKRMTHVVLASDGARTWVGVGADLALVTAKLAAALGSSGDKLTGRADLASLKAGSVGAAGFASLRGTAEAAALGMVEEGNFAQALAIFEAATQTPDQGATAIPFSMTPGSEGSARTAVTGVQLPRPTIQDLSALVRLLGAF